MADISKVILPDNNEYNIVSRQTRGLYRGTVDATSTSTVFTAQIEGITEYYDGLTVLLKNTKVASAAGYTVNINDLGAKTVWSTFSGAQSSTGFTLNSEYMFIYDGTNQRWNIYMGYYTSQDGNTIGEYAGTVKAGTNGIKNRAIMMRVSNDTWESCTTTSGTGTSKTKNTSGFIINGDELQVLLTNATSDYASGSNVGQSSAWCLYPTANARYSFNVGTSWSAAGRPLFLKGTITDNKFYLADVWYVDAWPVSEDNYYYVYLGQMYSAYQFTLQPNHPIFYYKANVGIRRYYPSYIDAGTVNGHTVDIDVPSDALFTDTTYSEATTTTSGLMSASDKAKLDGMSGTLAEGANINLTTSNGTTTISLDDTVTTGEIITDEAQVGDLIVTGNSSFTNTINGDISGNAATVNNHTVLTDVPSGAVFTDQSVTSSANHYSPSTASGQNKSASASGGTAAWSIDVVQGVTLNTDGKGHVTGISVTSGKIPAKPTYTASDVGAIPTSAKGVANGVAELDENGKVPSAQLPSYVDDVIEGYYYNNKFYKEVSHTTEIPGESGKIYVDLSTEKTYRWGGSSFVVISETLSLGETSSTAYRGDRGKTAYDHSQLTSGNPHNVTKADVGLSEVGNFKAVSTVANQNLTNDEKSNARANIGAGTSSLTLGTGSGNAYYGDKGNTAYTHATDANRLTTATASGLYKVASTNQGHIAGLTAVVKSDITGLGIPGSDTTYSLTQDSSDGHKITLTPSSGTAQTVTIPDNDSNVSQSETTTSDWRKIALGSQHDASAGTAVSATTSTVYVTPSIEVQPSTGTLRATSLKLSKVQNQVLTGTGTAGQDKGSSANPRYFPSKWTFNAGITPADGDIIVIKLPVAGHDYGVFISVNNGTNYYPISVTGTTRLTTQYGNGQIIALVFASNGQTNDVFALNGSNSRTNVSGGCWRTINYYDSGNSYSDVNRYTYFAGKTGTKGIWQYQLFMEDGNGKYQGICTASDGTVTSSNRTTATTKIANTSGFRVGSQIYYSNAYYNANTNISGWAAIYNLVSTFDTRYSFNTTLTAGNLTAYTPLYLVGTINSADGLFYLDQTWWTQTPNDSTKVYVLVGGVYDSTASNCRATLYEDNKWFQYIGNRLVEIVNNSLTVGGYTIGTTSVGSASAGTDIPADDITSWTTNTPTVVTKKTVVTGGSKTSIPNISKKTVVTGGEKTSIPNISKKTVVTSVTKKTVVTSATFNDVVTGGETTNIPNISKKTVVTSASFNDVVTGGSTTDIPNISKKTVVTSASGATASYADGILTITNGSFGTGDSVTVGTPIAAYTTLNTGAAGSATTGDSVTVGTPIAAYTSLSTGAAGSASTGDSVAVATGDSVTVGTPIEAYTSLTTGDSVTVGTPIEAYTSLTTGDSVTVTPGTAATLEYTAKSIPNISVSNKTVATATAAT